MNVNQIAKPKQIINIKSEHAFKNNNNNNRKFMEQTDV